MKGIEEARIERALFHTNSKDGSHSHSWDDEDHAFDYQLDQWSVEKLSRNVDEEITREFKIYPEEWRKSISRIRAKYQKPCFLQNMGVWLYMKKIRKKYLS